MFAFLFGVSSDLFGRGELVLMSDWPLSVLGGLIFAAVCLVTFLLTRQRRALAAPKLAAIGLLQLAMVALVLVILWQPALRTERLRAGDNVVAIMLDGSESMFIEEESASRIGTAQSLLAERVVPALEQEHIVQRFVFSERARAVESFDSSSPPGQATRIGESVLQVLRQARTTPLGAVIVVSDGADNSSGQLPEEIAELAGFGVPLHTIGVGREQIPEDLELSEVTMPGRALPGTTLSARVAIRHDGAGTSRVKVYDGDTILSAREVALAPDTTVTTAWIDFPVPDEGHHDLRFSLDRLPGERNARNNSRRHALEVPEDRYRILYMEGEPRWEYKFLRRALVDDPSVALISVLRVSPNKFYRQGIERADELAEGFPADRAELFAYDALIIGSIEAARFSIEQHDMLRDFVGERGGSVLMLAGANGLGAGGWGNSALGDVLPSRLSDAAGDFTRAQFKVALTPVGRQSSILRLAERDEDNDRLWRDLPDIGDYQTIGPLRPAAVTLLDIQAADDRAPLLVTQPYGRGHSYILATGGTWRWQMSMPLEDLSHETFWRQLARGLVANSPHRFDLSAQVQGDRVTLLAEVRDPEFKPQSDITVSALVATGDSEAQNVTLGPGERPGVFVGEFTPGVAGVFFVEAVARRDGETVDTARLSLRYDAPMEYFDVRQNRELLQTLATASGGQYWRPDELQGLADAVRHSAAGVTEQNFQPLWHAPALFLLLLLLKSGEWLLRRLWRTI